MNPPLYLLPMRAGFLLTLLLPLSVSSHESLVEIEVIGRKVNLLGDALSASEGRVSFQEIRQRPVLRAGDVLETVPGLVATQHSGSGKANQLFLRGFNLDHGTDFATSIDGMPVNLRSHGHGQGYTDLNFIIPEMVQEILYRKGPYYAEVGDFSGAGSANFVTRDNSVDSVVQLGAGEFGYTRALAMANARGVGGDLVFALEHQRYDGPWENLEEDVGKTNLQLKQFWQGESGETTLSLMAYRNGWNAADQIPDRAVQSGLISKLGSLDPTTGGESSRYSLSLSSQSEIASGDLSVNVFAIDYDMDLYSNFTYFTSSEGDQFKQIDSRRIYGGNITLESEQEWASQTVINTFGADVRLDDINEVGLLSTSGRRIRDTLRLDRVIESTMSQKIRIKLKSYDYNLVDKSAEKIVKTVKTTGAVVTGPIPLPTNKKIFTVLRSPHVNKKSREQFQLSSYKRLLDIYSSSSKTIDALMKLELPSGVEVEIKV
jgi:ribosomal protein S10